MAVITELASTPSDYTQWLAELKTLIRTSRVKASLAVNRELVMLYWRIGSEIITRQTQQGWGAKVIEQLANDLRNEFPDMKGLSRSNLKYMRVYADSWQDGSIGHQLGGQIPWRHNCLILDKLKDPELRKWIGLRCKMGRTDASRFKHPKSAKQSFLRNRSAPVIPDSIRDPCLLRCRQGA
jgi:predicted nuclease of restriction endonuclease-like (RecB) superfamily